MESPDLATNLCQNLRQTHDITCDATAETGSKGLSFSRDTNAEAAEGLRCETGKLWGLSRDHHYRFSNRFAWSWKLATFGLLAVLVYLGFLNAQEMADEGHLLRTRLIGPWL